MPRNPLGYLFLYFLNIGGLGEHHPRAIQQQGPSLVSCRASIHARDHHLCTMEMRITRTHYNININNQAYPKWSEPFPNIGKCSNLALTSLMQSYPLITLLGLPYMGVGLYCQFVALLNTKYTKVFLIKTKHIKSMHKPNVAFLEDFPLS